MLLHKFDSIWLRSYADACHRLGLYAVRSTPPGATVWAILLASNMDLAILYPEAVIRRFFYSPFPFRLSVVCGSIHHCIAFCFCFSSFWYGFA
jgi:hypothetical protein